jgi:peptidoglycan/LPS O-acetylase OafA/YrhL
MTSRAGGNLLAGTAMIVNIQVLRAVAALAVVLHHLQFQLNLVYGTPTFALVGRAGVDLFFLISGFVMVYTTRDENRTATQFWMDRAVRIVPLYWLGTALVIVLFLAGLPALDVRELRLVDVVRSFFFIPYIATYGEPRPILDVGWTLNYEIYFYALFGLAFFVRSQVKALALLGALFVAIWIFVKLNPQLPFAIAHYGSALVFEFLIGGVIALWHQRWLSGDPLKRPGLGVALVLAGLVAVFIAGWRFAAIVNENPELRVAVFGGPAVLVLVGALLLEQAGYTVKSRLVLLLGAASYAIYLAHPLVLQVAVPAFNAILPGGSLVHKAGAIVFAYTLAVAAGLAVHLWVERPMTARLRAMLRRKPKPAQTQAT